MCGIAGILSLDRLGIPELDQRLSRMSHLIRHRGPDGDASWTDPGARVGFTHRRLSIIDLATGDQPMRDQAGNWIVLNGEIYNYRELRDGLGPNTFRTTSDTEVVLAGYRRWGQDVVSHLRGMFAFAIWDEGRQELFCARDRFGMKPFYYAIAEKRLYFASEAKALLPFVTVATDVDALKDYLAFQVCLDGKTLFRDIRELPAGNALIVVGSELRQQRYWDVRFELDMNHTAEWFQEELRRRIVDSIRAHLVADVPVGAYVSGGLDSAIIAVLAADQQKGVDFAAFTGAFPLGPEYDERRYARELATSKGLRLRELEIGVGDFTSSIQDVIYHLDYPVAGPGAFAQYMVSRMAASERKVVLGGQGGDELFGGYARYLIAYLEQCLKGAIDGTMENGDFIVSYASILPNLTALRSYKPLLKEFWSEGLFQGMDERYFRLINRSAHESGEVRWNELGDYSPFETFRSIFRADNIEGESYFDRMTHFDFKALLPGLLQVEDRMSMAHGLESRLPFLDHPLVEFVATIPPHVKFEGGRLKRVLRAALGDVVPPSIGGRDDKMGFPTPFNTWAHGEAKEFVRGVMTSQSALNRDFIDNRRALETFESESEFGRNFWGFFSLELWQRAFHDRAHEMHWDSGVPAVITTESRA